MQCRLLKNLLIIQDLKIRIFVQEFIFQDVYKKIKIKNVSLTKIMQNTIKTVFDSKFYSKTGNTSGISFENNIKYFDGENIEIFILYNLRPYTIFHYPQPHWDFSQF